MTRALRLVLFTVMVATLLAWLSHRWNVPIDAPWHPWMPWAFWTSFITLLAGPHTPESTPPETGCD